MSKMRLTRVFRDDLKSVLGKTGNSLDVRMLLDCIGQTSDFEREMSKRFNMPVGGDIPASKVSNDLTASLEQFESILALSPTKVGASPAHLTLTSVFEPHLGVFVDAQDRSV